MGYFSFNCFVHMYSICIFFKHHCFSCRSHKRLVTFTQFYAADEFIVLVSNKKTSLNYIHVKDNTNQRSVIKLTVCSKQCLPGTRFLMKLLVIVTCNLIPQLIRSISYKSRSFIIKQAPDHLDGPIVGCYIKSKPVVKLFVMQYCKLMQLFKTNRKMITRSSVQIIKLNTTVHTFLQY